MTSLSPTTSQPSHGWQIALMALTGAFAFGGVTLMGGSGCTVLTNDALPDDAGIFEAGDGGESTCNACGADKCTAVWAVCLTSVDCLAIRTCASTATDSTSCACSAQEPDAGGVLAESAYRAFAMCNDARLCTTCASDCASTRCKGDSKKETPGPCAGEGDASSGDASTELDAGDASADDAAVASDAGDAGSTAPTTPTADTCASCANGKCGDAKKQCAIGTECAAFLACAFACTNDQSACMDDCGRLHATGKVAAVDLATCTQASCEAECGFIVTK